MNTSLSFARALVVLAVLALGGAACSASTTVAADSAAATPGATVEQNSAPVEAAPAATVAAELTAERVEPIEGESAEAPPAGQGVVEVVFDDGRSWTLEQMDCSADPDGAIGLLVEGVGAGTLELNVISTRALAEFANPDAEQLFIGTFIDDQEQLYVFEDPENVQTGADGSISFTAKLHTNVFYALGDAPAVVGTFSC